MYVLFERKSKIVKVGPFDTEKEANNWIKLFSVFETRRRSDFKIEVKV